VRLGEHPTSFHRRGQIHALITKIGYEIENISSCIVEGAIFHYESSGVSKKWHGHCKVMARSPAKNAYRWTDHNPSCEQLSNVAHAR